jgi:hypothetical protein
MGLVCLRLNNQTSIQECGCLHDFSRVKFTAVKKFKRRRRNFNLAHQQFF